MILTSIKSFHLTEQWLNWLKSLIWEKDLKFKLNIWSQYGKII